MKFILLLAGTICLFQSFTPPVQSEPVSLVVLGAVAAAAGIAGYGQGLWKTYTTNHCWPKNIDLNAFFSEFYSKHILGLITHINIYSLTTYGARQLAWQDFVKPKMLLTLQT